MTLDYDVAPPLPGKVYRWFPHGCWMMGLLPVFDWVVRWLCPIGEKALGVKSEHVHFSVSLAASMLLAITYVAALFALTAMGHGRQRRLPRRYGLGLRVAAGAKLLMSLMWNGFSMYLLFWRTGGDLHGAYWLSSAAVPFLVVSRVMDTVVSVLLCLWLWNVLVLIDARGIGWGCIGMHAYGGLLSMFMTVCLLAGWKIWVEPGEPVPWWDWRRLLIYFDYGMMVVSSVLWLVLAVRFRVWARCAGVGGA